MKKSVASHVCFNPRTREGRDALARWQFDHLRKFQSTRPRGARLAYLTIHASDVEFQSTRPRGARQGIAASGHFSANCFNPRARKGRDPLRNVWLGVTAEFQSTRPRGARHSSKFGATCGGGVSIHAPAGGATRSTTIPYFPPDVSIHAPAGGATVK